MSRRSLTDEQKSELFLKYLPLAHSLAARFSDEYRLPFGDCVTENESSLALCIAHWGQEGARGYDPWMSTPTAWIYKRLVWDFKTYLRQTYKTQTQKIEVEGKEKIVRRRREVAMSRLQKPDSDEEMDFPSREEHWLEKLLRNVSEDAGVLIRTILSAPSDLARDLYPARRKFVPKALKERLRVMGRDESAFDTIWQELILHEYLQDQGWCEKRIRTAWNEVAECL